MFEEYGHAQTMHSSTKFRNVFLACCQGSLAASHILGPFSDTEIYFRRSSSLGEFIRHAQGSLFLHLGLLRQTPCTNNKREQAISSPIGTIRNLPYPTSTITLPYPTPTPTLPYPTPFHRTPPRPAPPHPTPPHSTPHHTNPHHT